MLLYNVTCNVDLTVADAWLYYMQAVHIPEVLATGCFVRSQICRLLDEVENEGVTYAVQYYCPDAATLEAYQRDFAPALRADMEKRFPEQFVAFRTVLEVIE